jgi:hypothetical protein
MSKTTLYHVTSVDNLLSIARDGLQPRCGERSTDADEAIDAIYTFPSLEAVQTGADGWMQNTFDVDEPLALLAFEVDGASVRSSGAEWEVQIHHAIDAGSIKVLSTDIWEEVDLTEIDCHGQNLSEFVQLASCAP